MLGTTTPFLALELASLSIHVFEGIYEAPYDGDSFWICRSSVYSPLRDGRAVKPTHHGYPVDRHQDFGEIIEHNLKETDKITKCCKTHLVTPSEALRFGRPLGAQTVKEYNINWVWDQKRKLMGDGDLWGDWVDTEPWDSIEELIETLKIGAKRGRQISPETIKEIRRLRSERVPVREIARLCGCSTTSVYKYSLL